MPARTARAPDRSARFAQLLAAGLTDSFGMTLGWTVFSLLVLERGWALDEYERWLATSLAAALLPAPPTSS